MSSNNIPGIDTILANNGFTRGSDGKLDLNIENLLDNVLGPGEYDKIMTNVFTEFGVTVAADGKLNFDELKNFAEVMVPRDPNTGEIDYSQLLASLDNYNYEEIPMNLDTGRVDIMLMLNSSQYLNGRDPSTLTLQEIDTILSTTGWSDIIPRDIQTGLIDFEQFVGGDVVLSNGLDFSVLDPGLYVAPPVDPSDV